LTLEFLWPSRRARNPVSLVRDAFRRRDRARRYAQIVAITSRHGLGVFRAGRRRSREEIPAALVATLNEAGVTFVKLGQMLSARDDVLPRELTDALGILQADSTPLPWEQARMAIEQQLGRPIDEVFAEVDPEPLAAASVAQVHAARMPDGTEVVIKIQRPAARTQVRTDLDILSTLAHDAERGTDWARDYQVVALADEFARSLSQEMDYRIEVANAEMLRGPASGRIRVPRTIAALCTEQLIVQERAIGTPFARLTGADRARPDARQIADDVLDEAFSQIAVRGVFHADLHAGNLILSEDGTVTLIDFGAVGILEKSMRRLLLPLLVAMANEDDVAATDIVLLLVAEPEGGVDTAALQHDIGVVLTRLRHLPGLDENIFRSLLDVMRRHRLGIPPALLLVFRTLGSLEGTLRRLDPEYDMVGRALARSSHFVAAAVSPTSAAMSLETQLALTLERVRTLPRRFERIASSLEKGTLSVRVRAFDAVPERSFIDSIVGQFTMTFVGAALVVTGILLAVSGGGPMITSDVPGFAFIGSIAGLAGLLLLLRVLRLSLRRRDDR
ncbi:MAG TPA: AarF/UbiB family protein, partial [Microbacterium sp.]|nr:AarF/UbiB family protein [Microbacterium sp.]